MFGFSCHGEIKETSPVQTIHYHIIMYVVSVCVRLIFLSNKKCVYTCYNKTKKLYNAIVTLQLSCDQLISVKTYAIGRNILLLFTMNVLHKL